MALTLTAPTAEPDPLIAAAIEAGVAGHPAVSVAIPDPRVLQATQTRRVTRADVEELRNWLIPRIADRHKMRNAGSLHMFLVSAIDSPEFLFVRNDRAVALVTLQRMALASPRIVEAFCFAIGHPGAGHVSDEDDDRNAEASASAATLYPMMAAWGRNQGIDRFIVLTNSDATESAVQRALGCKVDRLPTPRWVDLCPT
jgi:hypothetical protein